MYLWWSIAGGGLTCVVKRMQYKETLLTQGFQWNLLFTTSECDFVHTVCPLDRGLVKSTKPNLKIHFDWTYRWYKRGFYTIWIIAFYVDIMSDLIKMWSKYRSACNVWQKDVWISCKINLCCNVLMDYCLSGKNKRVISSRFVGFVLNLNREYSRERRLTCLHFCMLYVT